MNNFYYVIRHFTQEDLQIIHDFFNNHVLPIHKKMHYEKISDGGNIDITGDTNLGVNISLLDINDLFTTSISKILEKYPMLGKRCLINELVPGKGGRPHIDGHIHADIRMCAINFLMTTDSTLSPVQFYGQKNDFPSYYDEEKRSTYLIDSTFPKVVDEVYMDETPILINVKSWHNVRNMGEKTRLVFSWTCKNGISFENAKQMLTNF